MNYFKLLKEQQEINKLDLDILRQDLGRIKFIIQKDVRKTLSTHGQIKLKEKSDLDEGYLLGFFTMRLVADIFSWFDGRFVLVMSSITKFVFNLIRMEVNFV